MSQLISSSPVWTGLYKPGGGESVREWIWQTGCDSTFIKWFDRQPDGYLHDDAFYNVK